MFANEEINNQTDREIYDKIMVRNAPTIGLIGLGFKPGTPVTTEGIATKFLNRIKNFKCQVYLYDRYSDAIDDIIKEHPDIDFVDCRVNNYKIVDVVSACDSIAFCNGDKAYLGKEHFEGVDMFDINAKNIVDPWRIL